MPPKKLPSKLTPQGSALNPPPTARTYRQPLPAPNLPPTDSIPPLWTPNALPTEVFPEWTDPAALPIEHWGTAEEPYEDPLAPENLVVPQEVVESKGTITWKRPTATAAADHHDQPWQIPRDFQRRWSVEQTDALQAWAKEKERIQREQQNRERVYMGFEDAIAYIVNERPRDLLAEGDFDEDDLVDDGEDEDEALTSAMDVSNATSPWGVVPPPRIEVAPNSVFKPEIPHGEIIHANMASYFRVVEQLYSSNNETSDEVAQPTPFLWHAIYPQDSTGHPVYNPGGKYSVKLFVFGRWRRIDVDDKLPLDVDGNIVYLSSSMKNEIWPSLLVKALYKVIMCQNVVQTMLALTSWKVSRWEPQSCESFSENAFHQLHQYVPSAQEPEQTEETNEAPLESETVADGTSENPPTVAEITNVPATASPPTPRAIICSAGSSRVADMIFGEAVLVTGIVGEIGNTTFKDAPSYWRSLSNVHVIECDGTYPVMLPGTWNILFKQSFELNPPAREDGDTSPPELRIDLHLSEELLASSTHISIVNDATIDCAPGCFQIREGKWKLTMASDWNFAKSTTHQMKMTQFEGTYEPNKPLLCFRDMVLQLLSDGTVLNDLAAKLEVFYFGAEQHPRIGEISSKGSVRLLQLPSIPASDNAQPPADDKRGYIIQARSSRVLRGIKWRLRCWSTEDVKLQEDNTKELQYDAIRASWAEKAVDRNTNGAVSRLLYLRRLDEAEARMKQDNMTEEQIAKIKSRFEGVQAIKAKVASKAVESGNEMLLSDDQLAESKRVLLERIGAVEADKEQRRVVRALAKEERAKELKSMIRSVVEKRAVSLKKQHEQKRGLSVVHTQSA
uniref:Calpain catalytic domain-containing protein n=1 Tax=Phytophthora ramorum TaxID=164328 RepID=H3HDN3_PHYRM